MRKQVITGQPCSGKTTLLDVLSNWYITMPEAARSVLEAQQTAERLGQAPIYPWLSAYHARRFQELVTDRQLDLEWDITGRIPRQYQHTAVFLDRSLVDQVAYCQVLGVEEPAGLRTAIERAGYETVYFLAAVPYVQDVQRTETPERAQQIGEALRNAYEEFGFRIVDIPPVDVYERVEMVVRDLGLSAKAA